MAEATTDAFLSGQGIPISPREIEAELSQLWGPAAEQVGGPDLERPAVTRIVLANLIVAVPKVGGERIEGVLDEVVMRHPCRAIVLKPDEAPDRRVRAEVSALCHLPAPGRPQVCSERIILRAGPQAFDLVPAVVRPLLEADLPCVLWWADDPRNCEELFGDLLAEATRLVLDLPNSGSDPAALRFALDPARTPFGRDIAWFGITRWRELIAGLFDPPRLRDDLNRITSVWVRARVPRPGPPPREAVWLVAWLAGQLGWEPLERLAPGPDRIDARFRGPAGEITVAIRAAVEPAADSDPSIGLTGVTLSTRGPAGEGVIRLERPAGSAEVRIEVHEPSHCNLPRLVLAPQVDAPGRLAAALESSRDDPPFRNALPHALWLLGVMNDV